MHPMLHLRRALERGHPTVQMPALYLQRQESFSCRTASENSCDLDWGKCQIREHGPGNRRFRLRVAGMPRSTGLGPCSAARQGRGGIFEIAAFGGGIDIIEESWMIKQLFSQRPR